MGLAEKRLAESIKTEKLPAFEEKLKERSGYDIKVDIDWSTFTAYDEYPLSRLDIVFNDIESFVKKICSDDMGREALQESMKTIRLTNTDDSSAVKMELKDSTLFLNFQLAGSTFSSYTDSQIASYVEGLL
ncbi:hypothetical protein [Flavobacterium reichenbachii]|uniref:Uncharacterized protein n=1 Tax=Flavobacterium reichenbachii TaxID=362418 RepID=A0A085ZI05_9FLAO|nr:hypothetical protein [Flavobacterium reichenbachii]KFF04069.1 hypothetical protein IW19_00325 [Flavobacterium reichenbachii]OXB12879.1 hypothetical protein B0A68_17085 [Flavobacterium reichenbachii]